MPILEAKWNLGPSPNTLMAADAHDFVLHEARQAALETIVNQRSLLQRLATRKAVIPDSKKPAKLLLLRAFLMVAEEGNAYQNT